MITWRQMFAWLLNHILFVNFKYSTAGNFTFTDTMDFTIPKENYKSLIFVMFCQTDIPKNTVLFS